MAGERRQSSWWLLGLPGIYLVHLGEEWWGGEGFASWTSRVVAPVSETRFLLVNGIAAPLFVLATVLAITRPSWTWFIVTFATIVMMNGLLHVLGTVLSWSYSPGVISGALLYLPLGALALRLGRTRLPDAVFWRATVLGVAIHGVVAIVAFWR